jgi:alpha-amylase
MYYLIIGPIQPHRKFTVSPWWLIYQPLGFKIGNRLGSKLDFQNLVAKCNSAGVKVVVEVVMNNLVTVNQEDSTGGFGTSLPWRSSNLNETFPENGFNASHFHDHNCSNTIVDYSNDFQVKDTVIFGFEFI